MTPLQVRRLFLTSTLFLAWLGYLAYLVGTRPLTSSGWPLVLSRPQIMASPIDVVVDVSEQPGGEIVVKEILWPKKNAPFKEGAKLRIDNLDECRPLPRRPGETPPADYSGPGLYLVPLRPSDRERGKYEVAPIPPSPGFHVGADPRGGPTRIYPATEEALAQYHRIEKSE